ncbi:desmocollin 2-like protein [Lampris incognitus]|uniref:desmocollin 2-like protein n=1 Tax=Lampris incognitus TaxID=2546036 RepID=UPI0024B5D4A9|nr:desmocollin 2-like protein [Lampris incognitus]
MAPGNVLRLCVCVSLLSQLLESCTYLQSIQAHVPVKVDPGYIISRVPLQSCNQEGLRLTSSDPRFTVGTDGAIMTVKTTLVTENKSFWVWVGEEGGEFNRIEVQLTPDPEQERVKDAGQASWLPLPSHMQKVHLNPPAQKAPWDVAHKRSKRRWSPLPFNIIEQDVPPFPKDVELVGSDSSVNYSVYYTLRGPGITLPPLNLFSVDRSTGMVRVHYAVDREQYSQFVFEAQVFDKKTGRETDRPLDVTVLVNDINDNAPTFSGSLQYRVQEQCGAGVQVGVVTAADRDQHGLPHSAIRYSLLTQRQLFNIHPSSGLITTRSSSLDREVQAAIPVIVEIRDMGGAPNGLFSTATATVSLTDINDNPPTFTHSSYKARIQENQSNVLVLRIPVDDKDEEKTKHWKAVFVITEGNENNTFRMDTDPKTNEGLLYVVKPLDYEAGRVVVLRVSAQNEAPLAGTTASWLSVPVELTVGDVDEGPEFRPPNMVIRVKENIPNGTVIGTYTALDPETKSSKGLKYYRMSDPGSWVSVAESTGELRVTNTIDFESPLVTNAMYNITVKAVDLSSKSGLGTVTLQIEDVNDNVPVIPPGVLVLCAEEGKLGYVTVPAQDPDLSPYSDPFNFQVLGSDWRIREATNTSVVLEQTENMPRGMYEVPIHITDLQNNGGVQVVSVKVCRCLGGECVAESSSISLGVWGVLAMLLAVALLLLFCIVFVIACTTKEEKMYSLDDASGGVLLKSNTEAPGEEVKSADLFMIPTSGGMGTIDGSVKVAGSLGQREKPSPGLPPISQQTMGQQTMSETNRHDFMMTRGESSFYTSGLHGGTNYSDSGFYRQKHLDALHMWDTNRLYLDKKMEYFGGESTEHYANDIPHVYGYEGEGSAAGSVGCCSDLGDLESLDFLDSLGSKFKTLASICMDREGQD